MELITNEEILEIQKQFDSVIKKSQNFYPHTDELFENWKKNKSKFIEWLGGLTYEYPDVSFELSEEQRDNLVQDFLLEAHRYLPDDEYNDLQRLVMKNIESFFNNLICYDYEDTPIKKGMRLSKAFKYIIKDKDLMTQIQQIASMYIQKGKISGTLCLSVHPLDYLSISENNCNWRSCHALDGEYCAGNLSYMSDACTVICYLKTHEDEQLNRFPDGLKWNNKKWRVLLFFGEDDFNPVFLGRQYPFDIDGILPFLEIEVLKGHYYDFQNDYIDHLGKLGTPAEYIALETGHGIVEFLNKFDVIQDESELHYNDLLQSNYYKPYYTSKINLFTKIQPRVRVGSKVKCLCCGERYILSGQREMVCGVCSDEIYGAYRENCAICGDRHDIEDMYLVSGSVYGDYVCQACYEDGEVAYCQNCGELFYSDDLVYVDDLDCYYCTDCYADLKEEM